MKYNTKDLTDYLNYLVKEGVLDPESFHGMTAKQLAKMATALMDRADAYADSVRKGEV